MHSKRMRSYGFAGRLRRRRRDGSDVSRLLRYASVTLDDTARDIVTAQTVPWATLMVECYADDATARTDGVHFSTDRPDVVTASLVARGGNASQVKRFGIGITPGGEASVSSRCVDIAIEQSRGKP